MRVPLTWLADLVRLAEPAAALAEHLTMAGLAVDAVDEVGACDPLVRVGRIEETTRHPEAERLRVCRIVLGDASRPVTIVSAAPGLARGMLVAVASPGARLADGTVVDARTFRGVESAGVLCSAAEVGLGSEADRVLALPRGTTVGASLADVPGVRDTVLEVDVTPNRGDCLSMLGIARELAAATGTRLRRRRAAVREAGTPVADDVEVIVEDAVGCPRYLARVVRGVRHARSPLWLRLRLERAGMRSIDAVVDAANHVMLETGQPLHTFDRSRVRGDRIVVRRARAGESIETLDGVTRDLVEADLVIADAAGPVAIAGVMGGGRTEVGPETTSVLLESAFFDPASIRRTARRLGLSSEASYRFERRVDPAMVGDALDALAAVLARLTSGRAAPGVVVAEAPDQVPRPRAIAIRPERARATLGVDLPATEMRRRLRAIGAAIERPAVPMCVTPPSHRADLESEAALIGEIARVGGYETVPATMPVVSMRGARDAAARILARRVRRCLAAEGLAEAVTPPFVAESLGEAVTGWVGRGLGPARLVNPLSAEHATLRRSPLAGLVRALALNVDRGAEFVGLFEIGTGFGVTAAGAREERRAVAAVLAGTWAPRGAERRGPAVEFGDMKGILENLSAGLGFEDDALGFDPAGAPALWHPGRSVVVTIAGRPVGALGAVHPKAAQLLDISEKTLLAEVDFQALRHYRPGRSVRPLPRYPVVTRDIAVVVEDEFRSEAVLEEIGRLHHPLIASARLFDCYRGDPIAAGKKSLAYTIAYRAADRTLTDDEVAEAHEAVRARLRGRFTLDLRS
jgi:phenylalanyl-tRNA synthetase beta chain